MLIWMMEVRTLITLLDYNSQYNYNNNYLVIGKIFTVMYVPIYLSFMLEFTNSQEEMDGSKMIEIKQQDERGSLQLKEELDEDEILDSTINYRSSPALSLLSSSYSVNSDNDSNDPPASDEIEWNNTYKDSPDSPTSSTCRTLIDDAEICPDTSDTHPLINVSTIEEQEREYLNCHAALMKKLNGFEGELQLCMFLKEISLNQCDVTKRHALLLELPHILEKEFPNCVLYPFGSGYSGVGFQQDVLSVYVDAFREYYLVIYDDFKLSSKGKGEN